jgi:two-component system response regulator
MEKEAMILLVEDNPDEVRLTMLALEENKITRNVVVATDGVEALDFLFGTGSHAGRDTQVQPQMILLDLKLPKLTGVEVLERLRADSRTRFIPVVILTSSNETRDMMEAYGRCANSYIRKPIDFTQYTRVVAQLGAYWLGINQTVSHPPTH